MSHRRIVPVYVLAVALGAGGATTSFGSSHSPRATCAPGNSNPNYCEGGTTTTTTTTSPTFTQPSTSPGAPANQPHNAPPLTLPTAQTGSDGSTTVAGTLTGQTLTLTAPPPTDPSQPLELDVNIAGEGTVIIQAGSTVLQVTVAKDGTTTITPPGGGDPIVLKGDDGKTAGKITIVVTGDTVTYRLNDPGKKTVQIGNATATVPGGVTITTQADVTSFTLSGSGISTTVLDPRTPMNFNATGGDTRDYVDVGTSPGRSGRAIRVAGGTSPSRNVIRTGPLNDRISGGAGSDVLDGGSGNDLIYGDRSLRSLKVRGLRMAQAIAAAARVGGPDTIIGAAGNDRLFGDGGRDSVSGGSGNDAIYGNNGDDVLRGGSGDDSISGGEGRDRIDAGAGDDEIHVRGHGLDTVRCGPGNDSVIAGPRDIVSADCETVVRG